MNAYIIYDYYRGATVASVVLAENQDEALEIYKNSDCGYDADITVKKVQPEDGAVTIAEWEH